MQEDASGRLQSQSPEGRCMLDGPLQCLSESAFDLIVASNIAPHDCSQAGPDEGSLWQMCDCNRRQAMHLSCKRQINEADLVRMHRIIE